MLCPYDVCFRLTRAARPSLRSRTSSAAPTLIDCVWDFTRLLSPRRTGGKSEFGLAFLGLSGYILAHVAYRYPPATCVIAIVFGPPRILSSAVLVVFFPCRGGGTGRRSRLKICRGLPPVPVRFRPSVPGLVGRTLLVRPFVFFFINHLLF